MNVLTAPKFLRREPDLPALPAAEAPGRPKAVVDFLTATDQMREENAYLRSEVETLARENKLANERIVRLTADFNEIKHERDWLRTHDGAMVNGLDNIKTLIVALEAKARAEAYAPPGTGQQDNSSRGDELAAGVAELAQKLAPEPPANA